VSPARREARTYMRPPIITSREPLSLGRIYFAEGSIPYQSLTTTSSMARFMIVGDMSSPAVAIARARIAIIA